MPSMNDFLAGAMLANGITWIWMQAVPVLFKEANSLVVSLLSDVSYIVYVYSGYIASIQVCKRADTNHLNVGLRQAGWAWVMSLIIMETMYEFSGGLALVLIICFAAGGFLGGYMTVRKRLNRLKSRETSA